MSNVVKEFTDKYKFLSNFYACKIRYLGITYPSVEHAYQACKTTDRKVKRKIAALSTPGQAKRFGKALELRDNWDSIKLHVMKTLLLIKFTSSLYLNKKLLATEGMILEEGNYWNDYFWGKVKGEGSNHLGRLLMEVRGMVKEDLFGKE